MKITKKILTALALVCVITYSGHFSSNVFAADDASIVVDFPDANLKKALLDNGIDTNKDGHITRGELAAHYDPNGMTPALDRLNLANKGITDLSGIEYAVNVKSIWMGGNSISDLTPLSKLSKLETLDISRNKVSGLNLSPLANLTNVRFLELSGNSINDITPLGTMSGLKDIVLSSNNISNLSPLANLTNLVQVFLDNNAVSDVSSLANKPYLRRVDLGSNNITSLPPIWSASAMQILQLSDNKITDISGLVSLASLEQLELDANKISDASPLANLTRLTNLTLNDNNISSAAPFARLTALEQLALAGNQISDVGPLAGLTNLKNLALDENKISNISPLKNLAAMQVLSLNANSISDIAALSNMNQLTELWLQYNHLTNLSPLAHLNALKELRLDNNQISDVTPLSKLINLHKLTIKNNNITDLYPLKPLINLNELDADDKSKSSIAPSTAGVSDGGIYNSDRVITFNNGTATLNDKPITSGTTVSTEGGYALFITLNSGVSTSIHFVIDKTPPVVTGVASGEVYAHVPRITYNEGKATLNGNPLGNGASVSEEGQYTLIVVDEAGNRTTIDFKVDKGAPIVRGVAAGGFYNSDKVITFDQGTATLNGKPFASGGTVSEDGNYELIVTNQSGKSVTIQFALYKAAPIVTGVSTGGVYQSAKVIHFDHGTATLNDKPFSNGDTVSAAGIYKLVVTDKAGNRTTIDFTMEQTSLQGVSEWAKSDILSASKSGLTAPLQGLIFTNSITREQFCEVAVKLYEAIMGAAVPAESANPFTDTANPEVAKAYRLGIVSGVTENTFSPDALITREQLTTMLKRVLDKTEKAISKGSPKQFADQSDFSAYAVDAIQFMSSIDVVQGMTETTFGPEQNATIEQAVIMAKRLHEKAVPHQPENKDSQLQQTSHSPQPTNNPTPVAVDQSTYTFDGNTFELYVKKSFPQPDGSVYNEYAITNSNAFTLSAYSAVYVTASTNNVKFEDDYYNYRYGGTLIIANHTNQPQQIQAKSIDYSVSLIYRDDMGTVGNPDGTSLKLKAIGPYIRMLSFDSDFVESEPYKNYIDKKKDLFIGDWMVVRKK